jgi:hypothetical protein
MNEFKNLNLVVTGKLGKLVHKQNRYHDFFIYFINYNIIIVQVRYITTELLLYPIRAISFVSIVLYLILVNE